MGGYICTSISLYIYICTHTYIHAYMHTCIHADIHTYIRTYIHTCIYETTRGLSFGGGRKYASILIIHTIQKYVCVHTSVDGAKTPT